MSYAVKNKILFCAFLVMIIAGSFSFSSEEVYETPSGFIGKSTYELNEAIIGLDKAAESFRFGRINIDSLRASLAGARLKFKKIEFLLAFQYPEYVKEHINGAPLLHLEKEGSRPKVVEPEGLQVLDELIFSEEAAADKIKIAALAKKLRNSYAVMFTGMDGSKVSAMAILAMRLQLVRIFTLGITGFDTPGSLNALPEAQASLEGMKMYFMEAYNGKDIENLFQEAINYLKQQTSFEEFDRLTFLKEYVDPLYMKLGNLEKNAETEPMRRSTAWNSGSKSIFAEDFLNPYFFSEIQKEEDTPELRDLGKALFYDPLVSSDGTMSCATCHQPEKAFADGRPKSLSSIQGKTVLRNAPTLLNAAYADRYFYDLRAFTLEQQAEHVIFNPEEFNTAYDAILQKLAKDERYAKLFRRVFGKGNITREKFSKALASYVLSLKSFNSPFDKYVRGEAGGIDPEVKSGFNLFMGKANCATCHFAPTFAGLVPPFYNENESEILGVLANPDSKGAILDTDMGRADNRIFSEYAWIYERSFKTTTVRNAAQTAPYFHNGAYQTLEEVIDFYNKGGGQGIGLPVLNQTLPPDALGLTDQEKQDLIAFINSLNDNPATK